MMNFAKRLELNLKLTRFQFIKNFLEKHIIVLLILALSSISVAAFNLYYQNGLGLAYNDARSHLDISRRVVEGLKPGIAQLGSVWLPLPHILTTLTVWNDFMWHSGLAGALVSMLAFVATGVTIYKYLEQLGVNYIGKLFGVFVFVANINILYLQSTAMTELLLLATMNISAYYMLRWYKSNQIIYMILSAFWAMLATLTRYDGWFLLFWLFMIVLLNSADFNGLKANFKENYRAIEGKLVLFVTLGSLGIVLWLLWNLIIFKDPLYFAYGPFSAKAQQDQLEAAGALATKGNLWLSFKFYMYALFYNSEAFKVLLAIPGAIVLWMDKSITKQIKIVTTALIAPLGFNILALFLGHSVLFIQGLSGDTWFNVRYGIMLMPSIAIFIGYLVSKAGSLRNVIIGLVLFTTFFQFASYDAVTIDDARVGSSQKNVTEVSGWLNENTADKEGFVLISAASHDAIIFSSGLPMKRFIHEGTGLYWESATALPDRWAKWIIMRTHDQNDLTYKSLQENAVNWEEKYDLVGEFPFADIYQLKEEYWAQVNTQPVIGKQR